MSARRLGPAVLWVKTKDRSHVHKQLNCSGGLKVLKGSYLDSKDTRNGRSFIYFISGSPRTPALNMGLLGELFRGLKNVGDNYVDKADLMAHFRYTTFKLFLCVLRLCYIDTCTSIRIAVEFDECLKCSFTPIVSSFQFLSLLKE